MTNENNIDDTAANKERDDGLRRFAELARAARTRRETTAPDVEAAWARFSVDNGVAAVPKRTMRIDWHTVRGVVIGAAAMFALMLAYNHIYNKVETTIGESEITAMHYDKRPQNVTLQRNDSRQTIAGRDSISFIVAANKAPQADAQTAPVQVDTKPLHVSMQKLTTPRGMDFKVLLPDGSEVWLNAESTIEFPSAFTGSSRTVSLKGEAYFKVARNEQQPFIVNTEKMSVKVLGTEFNLKSYKEETTHVSLVKGKVEVMQGGEDEVLTQLSPGQDAWMDGKGAVHVREVDTYAVTQWIRGYFFFDDAKLVDILRELSRWYNCGVVFNNRGSMDYRLHFSASRNVNLGQTIDNLNRLCKSKITIDGNTLVVD